MYTHINIYIYIYIYIYYKLIDNVLYIIYIINTLLNTISRNKGLILFKSFVISR